MTFVATLAWVVAAVAIFGSIVSYVIMECSRAEPASTWLTARFQERYKPTAFTSRGQLAQAWCMRFVVAAIVAMFVFGTLVVVTQK